MQMEIWFSKLTNRLENKRSKRQRRKEKYTHLDAGFQRIARRDKKTFLSDQCKEIYENKRKGKKTKLERLELSSGKSEISTEQFMQRWPQ